MLRGWELSPVGLKILLFVLGQGICFWLRWRREIELLEGLLHKPPTWTGNVAGEIETEQLSCHHMGWGADVTHKNNSGHAPLPFISICQGRCCLAIFLVKSEYGLKLNHLYFCHQNVPCLAKKLQTSVCRYWEKSRALSEPAAWWLPLQLIQKSM